MKKLTKMMMWLLSAVIIGFSACGENEEPVPPGSDGKAKIENLAISPASNLTYGDAVTLTGVLSDETGLSAYTIQISNSTGVIYENIQMLTGKTFNLNLPLVIPLPVNATAGNLTLSLSVRNSGNQITTEELSITNVKLPDFPKLYLDLNGTIYEMTKSGNDFTFENFVSAGATGKIYANADKTGIFWGWENGAVKVMGTNDIPIGKAEEAYFTVSFNTVTFALTLGDEQQWQPITGDDLFILGTISGNWRDNQVWGSITFEQNKMKMTATSLGNKKRWTWSPPSPEGIDDGPGCEEYTMWGQTQAGVFRLKKAGKEEYILYINGEIKIESNNSFIDFNFPIPAAGAFSIEVNADETGITSVRAFDDDQSLSLEYKNNEVLLGGVPALPSITFAGSTMNLVPGNYFVYEGTFDLTNNQSVTGTGINLAALYSDPDIFTGGGNSTWTFTGPTSTYYIRIDAFSGHVFIKNVMGYPDAIYMDGWCWKKHPGDPRNNWNEGTELTLHRVGTSSIYEATCVVLPWSGDIKFFALPADADNFPGGLISAEHFTFGSGQTVGPDGNGMMLPVPPNDGNSYYYKVSVDLKDGMNLETQEDETIVGVPKGAKFTYSFTEL